MLLWSVLYIMAWYFTGLMQMSSAEVQYNNVMYRTLHNEQFIKCYITILQASSDNSAFDASSVQLVYIPKSLLIIPVMRNLISFNESFSPVHISSPVFTKTGRARDDHGSSLWPTFVVYKFTSLCYCTLEKKCLSRIHCLSKYRTVMWRDPTDLLGLHL